VYLGFHPRRLFPSKFFAVNSFADPHPLNLYAASLYKNSGGQGYWFRSRALATHHPPLHSSSFFSHSCALFGTAQNSTRFFSSDCALFTPKHPGWGEVTGRVCRNYRGLNTANFVIVNPSAAPRNTSDGKCACVVTREKLIAPAAPYATHGTQRCCRYRCANTVAMENAAAA
jgi:hypothetical protein